MKKIFKWTMTLPLAAAVFFGGAQTFAESLATPENIHYMEGMFPTKVQEIAPVKPKLDIKLTIDKNKSEKYEKLVNGNVFYNLDLLKDDLVVQVYNETYIKKALKAKEAKKWKNVQEAGSILLLFQKKFPGSSATQSRLGYLNFDPVKKARSEVWASVDPIQKLEILDKVSEPVLRSELNNMDVSSFYSIWSLADEPTKLYFESFKSSIRWMMDAMKDLSIPEKVQLMRDAYLMDTEYTVAHYFTPSSLKGSDDSLREAEELGEMVEYMRINEDFEILYIVADKMRYSLVMYQMNDYLIETYGYYLDNNLSGKGYIPSTTYGFQLPNTEK